MFKKLFAALAVVVLTLTTAQAQPLCGSHLLIDNLEAKYPGYRRVVNATFDQALEQSESRVGPTIYYIPVVVHVVWNAAAENLPDSVIQSQIAVLNEDFRRMNADTINTRSVFKSRVGDARIQFYLAQVIRKQTTATFNPGFGDITQLDKVKKNAQGGSTIVNGRYNLNIWTCKIQSSFLGQILGYAYPPAGLSNWPAGSSAPDSTYEGVVIDYRAFGRNNPNPFTVSGAGTLNIEGRTPVHEVAHYLGLRHIWGDASNCSGTDGIGDTPKANTQSSFDCNLNRNTCTDTPTDVPDMVENFMDYSAETCMNSFTNGQIALMRSVLAGVRADLPKTCKAPTNTRETTIAPPMAVVAWNAVTNATQYQVRGGLVGSTATITSNPTANLSFTYMNLRANKTYWWQVRANCGFAWGEWSDARTVVVPAALAPLSPNFRPLTPDVLYFENFGARVLTNPVRNQDIRIELTDGAGDYQVTLMDVTGKKIVSTQWSITQDVEVRTLDTANSLAPGIYLVHIQNGTSTYTDRIVIQ
jgi:hypothetical protein